MNFDNNRILIVDDNPSIHEDYQKIFENRQNQVNPNLQKLSNAIFGESEFSLRNNIKFQLDFEFQGKDALETVKKSLENKLPYSMAFMDIRMPPGWDGIETIKRIWEVDPRIQMVICTAYSDYSWVEILDSIEHSESLLILKKPFESMEVLQMAYALTSRWSLARQLELKYEEMEEIIKVRTNELQEKTKKLYETEKIASIGIIASGIAHEFNNINTVILGFSDIALMDKKLEQPFNNYFKKIVTAATKGKEISKNLLTFAKKDYFEKKNANLKEIVLQSLNLFQKQLITDDIKISSDFQALPIVCLDQGMITQVLLNLLKNAYESLVDKTNKEIRIQTFIEQDKACISIEDTGNGIKGEDLKNIFTPFFSTKGAYSTGVSLQSKFQGTGLGLSVCQSIIVNHGGEIMVKSIEQVGSTFTIKLPVVFV